MSYRIPSRRHPKKNFKQWHQEQVEYYSKKELPVYERYAKALHCVLSSAAARIDPLCIVQARAKSVSSFAEKAIRKKEKYDDPATELTDLCGARVIAHTLEEVEAVSQFVRDTFEIDWDNSADARDRLKVSEFGYLSVHYIVQIPAKMLGKRLEGTLLSRRIGPRKAEIQIRTLLQHAWSDIGHDRLYKSGYDVPKSYRRDMSAWAATLEQVDRGLTSFCGDLGEYAGLYPVWLDAKAQQQEIEAAGKILAYHVSTHKTAKIATAMLALVRQWDITGEPEKIRDLLRPFLAGPLKDVLPATRAWLQRFCGRALSRLHARRPEGEDFAEGVRYLEAAGRPGEPIEKTDRLRAQALADLGLARIRAGLREEALDSYRLALECDPGNPYILSYLLTEEVWYTQQTGFLHSMVPALRAGVASCENHIRSGIALWLAHFTRARLLLLAGDLYEALGAYALGIAFFRENPAGAASCFGAERKALRTLCEHCEAGMPAELRWADRLLALGQCVVAQDAEARKAPREALVKQRRRPFTNREAILCFVGKSDSLPDFVVDGLGGLLSGFKATVICGGTCDGLPGWVGDQARRNPELKAVGYAPEVLPSNVSLHPDGYDSIINVPAPTPTSRPRLNPCEPFSPAEPLQYWTDLLASGVAPKAVRVLCVGGGTLTTFEVRLAAALGAPVGLMSVEPVDAPDTILGDAFFGSLPNILSLPNDPATRGVFLTPTPKFIRRRGTLDMIARKLHEDFIQDKPSPPVDPARARWRDLREDFKDSNRRQVQFARELFAKGGYELVPRAKRKVKPTKIAPAALRVLGEWEHGRWNVERLAAGWKFASKTDKPNRKHNCIVAWRDLPEQIRKYDFTGVLALQRYLFEEGWDLRKKPKKRK